MIPSIPPNKKETDIRYPPPSRAFVFIDEREDSIDDGYFAITLSPPSWQNCPAFWHNRVWYCLSRTGMRSIGGG